MWWHTLRGEVGVLASGWELFPGQWRRGLVVALGMGSWVCRTCILKPPSYARDPPNPRVDRPPPGPALMLTCRLAPSVSAYGNATLPPPKSSALSTGSSQ